MAFREVCCCGRVSRAWRHAADDVLRTLREVDIGEMSGDGLKQVLPLLQSVRSLRLGSRVKIEGEEAVLGSLASLEFDRCGWATEHTLASFLRRCPTGLLTTFSLSGRCGADSLKRAPLPSQPLGECSWWGEAADARSITQG